MLKGHIPRVVCHQVYWHTKEDNVRSAGVVGFGLRGRVENLNKRLISSKTQLMRTKARKKLEWRHSSATGIQAVKPLTERSTGLISMYLSISFKKSTPPQNRHFLF